MKNKIAVIILNYNSWKETLQEIRLCHDFLEINFSDIIVIDNNSPNDSGRKICEYADTYGFVFLQSKANNGYSAGNNIGLKYAFESGYEYGWILNNDIIINDSLIVDKIMAVFAANEKIAVVNPDIYRPDGYLFNRDYKRPNFFDFTLGKLHYRKVGRTVVDEGGFTYVYRPQGCCMMVDLNAMKEVDFLDEGTFLYAEEIILAERLREKGYVSACCLETSIIHNHHNTVKTSIEKKKVRKIITKSFSYYLSKYRNYNQLQIIVCCLFEYFKLIMIGQ